jgi:hypothetical protein
MSALMRRGALAGALCLAVVAGGAAVAAPKAACNLVTDKAGDGLVDQGALDVISADIATNKKTVTTVVRVANADLSKGTIPTGAKIQFTFTAGDQALFTGVTYDPVNGLDGYWGHQGDTGGVIEGSVTPVVDAAKKEIRVSVPRGAYSTADLKPGVELTKLGANADVIVATPKQVIQGNLRPFSNDTATSPQTYVAGARSCVAVGR